MELSSYDVHAHVDSVHIGLVAKPALPMVFSENPALALKLLYLRPVKINCREHFRTHRNSVQQCRQYSTKATENGQVK